MKTLINKENPAIRITAPEIVLCANKEEYWIAGIPQIPRTYLAKDWTLVEEEPEVDLEQTAFEYGGFSPLHEVRRDAFKAGAEWQKKQDELTWQDIAEIWHIVEDLYDSGDYTGDAAYLFYNEALEKFKKCKEQKNK